eukprot:309386-Hanusia_phi.AAC.2
MRAVNIGKTRETRSGELLRRWQGEGKGGSGEETNLLWLSLIQQLISQESFEALKNNRHRTSFCSTFVHLVVFLLLLLLNFLVKVGHYSAVLVVFQLLLSSSSSRLIRPFLSHRHLVIQVHDIIFIIHLRDSLTSSSEQKTCSYQSSHAPRDRQVILIIKLLLQHDLLLLLTSSAPLSLPPLTHLGLSSLLLGVQTRLLFLVRSDHRLKRRIMEAAAHPPSALHQLPVVVHHGVLIVVLLSRAPGPSPLVRGRGIEAPQRRREKFSGDPVKGLGVGGS